MYENVNETMMGEEAGMKNGALGSTDGWLLFCDYFPIQNIWH